MTEILLFPTLSHVLVELRVSRESPTVAHMGATGFL